MDKDAECFETPRQPRIGNALDLLKDELAQLQDQDILLLKQLMNIHYSIRMLKRKLCHRTNSFSNLLNVRSPYFTPPPVSRNLAAHNSLGRVMSEPTRYLMEQRSISIPTEDEEGEEETEDELAGSFNSSSSEILEPLQQSLNLDPETSSLLADMPVSLRRKYLSSLTQNNNSPFTARSRTLDKPRTSVSDSKFQTSCAGSVHRNKTLTDDDRDQFEGRFSSFESDSSAAGIEITAL